tara:strand:+ start:124 stop:588 length:465 start_codon:yes stop_codon:yes gene_type:complete
MFTVGIPIRQKRRALQYLKQKWIDFEEHPSMEGFVELRFPGTNETIFKGIIMQLKGQGITLIGVDDQLTEKNIMKLANLLKEESPEENDFIDDIRMALERNRQLFNNPMFRKISDIIKNYEMGGDEERMMSMPENKITEEKIRKFIRNEINKFN